MSDDNSEEIEIDPDHPWVLASTMMDPSPVPTGLNVSPVMMTNNDGQKFPMARLEIVTPIGCFTHIVPPEGLDALLRQGVAVMQALQNAMQQGLVVAQNMEQVASVHDLMSKANGHGPRG